VTAGSTDAFGNPVAGPAIVLLSRNQSIAKVSGNVVTADTTLGQTFISARWSTDSTVRDSMLVVVAHPTGPVIMSNLQRFDFRTDTVFTIPVIVDMRASGEKLGSTRVQISWNTAALTYVSDAEGSSNVGATVNTSNAASGVITLAVASSSGYTGAVEIRRITFRASVTAARSTLLTFGASELNGVSPTFTDLKPKTVGVSYPIHTR
jgi:hypothetical protein